MELTDSDSRRSRSPQATKSNGMSSSRSKSPVRHDRVERPRYNRDRPAPYQRGERNPGPRPSSSNKLPPYNRVFVNNIAYEEKWQGLKDKFREQVGEVTYVELFTDESGKSRGYGVVEFKTKELCEEAVKKMNRFEINNRKMVVKLDYNGDVIRKALVRDGHPAAMGMTGGPPLHGMPPPMRGPIGPLPPMPPPMGMSHHNPPMSSDALNLNTSGPIGNTVFVANLDYKVTYSKLKEVFQLAGRVIKVDLMLDKDNKSRGMATVTFEEPMEAAQAISMLNNQKLFDRTMIVKMDKDNRRDKPGTGELPSGLSGIGPALNVRNRDNVSGLGGFGDSPGLSNPLLSSSSLALSSLMSRLPEFNKSSSPQANLAASLTALTQARLSETLKSSAPSALGLSGFSELARLGLGGGSDSLDQRLLEEQRRLLASGFSDRERIERDIRQVDSRIRDIDRTMAATERGRGSGNMPPMPPPMNSSSRVPGTTVFVRNLPYSLSWQNLRDRFAKCGRVMFAEIKTDNGKSRGFGNVRFDTPEQAQAAVRQMDGAEIDGRKIAVHIDTRN